MNIDAVDDFLNDNESLITVKREGNKSNTSFEQTPEKKIEHKGLYGSDIKSGKSIEDKEIFAIIPKMAVILICHYLVFSRI